MTVRKSRRSVKLRPVREKTGMEMLKDLGYRSVKTVFDTERARFNKSTIGFGIIVRKDGDVIFTNNGNLTTASREEIIAIAKMFEEGEL